MTTFICIELAAHVKMKPAAKRSSPLVLNYADTIPTTCEN